MINITEKKNCNGCSACYSVCPQSCIEMSEDNEGFKYPNVNKDKCVNCNLCEKVCPILNEKTENKISEQITYAIYNLNINERLESSSGGIFTLLSKYILNQNGIVIGVAFNGNFKEVNHIIIDKVDDLYRLQGSKYIQSNINDIYKEVKKYLNTKRKVLFTGTPCQIGGLISYLGKEYDNLYTQDLICHGCPSTKVWRYYVQYKEYENKDVTKKIFFRDKTYGWKMYSVLFKFSNNTKYLQDLNHDIYMKGFLTNLYLRPSCYDCKFKTKSRQSDITLADFWGIENVFPEMDDDKGTSLMWIHSEKGLNLFDKIKDNCKYISVNIDDALKYNPSAIQSVPYNTKRDIFFNKLNDKNICYLIEKYTKVSLYKKIRGKLGKIKRVIFNINKSSTK